MNDNNKVSAIIDTIRPYIQADGGDVELVGVKDGIVYVNIQQTTVPVTFSQFIISFKIRPDCSCGRCAILPKVLLGCIETVIKREIPEIKAVEAASIKKPPVRGCVEKVVDRKSM
ncbi:MAG: NifU family protein [Methanosarcinales archaeon]|nr:NifU family protein [Methanosarcinales archaeon]